MELCIGAKTLSGQQSDSVSESALVEKCRRHDAEAFAKVVDTYQHRVYGFVRRMLSDSDEAADVSQEVFIRAYQAFGRFDGRSSLRTWLFRIAHNLCVDRARRRDRTPPESRLDVLSEDDAGMEIPDNRWDPERVVMSDELLALVEKGLETMSDKLKSVLLLHDKEDLAYDEIAKMLDLPVGTVKSRLFLARAHLQHALAGYLQHHAKESK